MGGGKEKGREGRKGRRERGTGGRKGRREEGGSYMFSALHS